MTCVAHRRCSVAIAGFTLLELLVALALSALLLALLSQAIGSLRVRSNAASQGAVAMQAQGDGEQALSLLIAGAVPSVSPGGTSTFVGTARSMEFLAAPPQALAAQGLLQVRLTVEPTTASQVGIYAETAPKSAGSLQPDRRLVVAGLASARFEYAARADTDMRSDWPAGGRPPALVRLHFDSGGPGEPRRGELVVAVRRQQTGGCRVDPISMNCRTNDAS